MVCGGGGCLGIAKSSFKSKFNEKAADTALLFGVLFFGRLGEYALFDAIF